MIVDSSTSIQHMLDRVLPRYLLGLSFAHLIVCCFSPHSLLFLCASLRYNALIPSPLSCVGNSCTLLFSFIYIVWLPIKKFMGACCRDLYPSNFGLFSCRISAVI
eukprot:TRINITY_DN18307_c2_g1_i1.p1 TRINITY_DN18307_c2_g1~~TRINITY_DN18307_c2_g1_i1.p1  ORF type:complete len:105 (-),score=0.72 TRINITY_DN18307_c2_g1_i1:627-941(-)